MSPDKVARAPAPSAESFTISLVVSPAADSVKSPAAVIAAVLFIVDVPSNIMLVAVTAFLNTVQQNKI